MKFDRVFTVDADAVEWNTRDAKIQDINGNSKFEMEGVEAPVSWSDNAVNIVASKYFKKHNGVYETSVKQLIGRVINKIRNWGNEFGYFSTEEDATIFCDELNFLLVNQYACFNSPVWFNFGVEGREQQAHACFLLGLEDTSKSITEWMTVESKIFKGGSGSGINLTPLRRKDSPLSTGGTASGPMSFAKAADCNAGVWKSGGATRRAAKLCCMNVYHGDIREFITCKVVEEKKAQALIAAGYDGNIDGEAYKTVAFQNMNHSVQVPDDFMKKVTGGDPEANELLDLIAQCAWESGDPGMQYETTINNWHTIPNSGYINTSNPCGEYLNTDWSACLLASFNLMKYRSEHEGLVGFDFDRFASAVNIFATALDIIIDGCDYPDERFKVTSKKQRQIGLGYSNLGALLMSMGLPYASEEGRDLAAEITSTMTSQAYIQSTNMAEELGPFEDFQKNREAMLKVIELHHRTAIRKWGEKHHCSKRWLGALELGQLRGYRNSVPSLIAPTGTISFMMDCDTTGIESEVALIKYKKLVGGGTLALVNSTVPMALSTLGYEKSDIDAIVKYIAEFGGIEHCPNLRDKDLAVFDCSLQSKIGSRFIDYNDHLKMVAAVQPFLAMGISKTINMPHHSTVEDVKKVYIDAWKMSIKSVSIYRDGSKHSQPLNVGKEEKACAGPTLPTMRTPLPAERPSMTHKFEVAGFEGYLHVGMYDNGMPGEIFIDASKVGSTVSGLLDAFATSISYGLQYGVPLAVLIEKFTNTRFEPAGFTKNPDIRMTTSIVDYIFKWMKLKFIDNKPAFIPTTVQAFGRIEYLSTNGNGTTTTGEICGNCGSMMQRTGTCLSCNSCGNAGGCG